MCGWGVGLGFLASHREYGGETGELCTKLRFVLEPCCICLYVPMRGL